MQLYYKETGPTLRPVFSFQVCSLFYWQCFTAPASVFCGESLLSRKERGVCYSGSLVLHFIRLFRVFYPLILVNLRQENGQRPLTRLASIRADYVIVKYMLQRAFGNSFRDFCWWINSSGQENRCHIQAALQPLLACFSRLCNLSRGFQPPGGYKKPSHFLPKNLNNCLNTRLFTPISGGTIPPLRPPRPPKSPLPLHEMA